MQVNDESDGVDQGGQVVQDQRGMTTAEYAVGTVAAVSFAGVLISVLTDPSVWQLIMKLIIFLLKLFWPDAPVGDAA